MLASKKEKIGNKGEGEGGGGRKRNNMRRKTLLKDTANTKPTINTTFGRWGQTVLPISILVKWILGTNFSNQDL